MSAEEKANSFVEIEVSDHAPGRTLIKNLLFAISGSAPDTPECDLKVKLRSSGEVIYSMRLQSGVPTDEGVKMIESDLERLTLTQFCTEYGIEPPR